MTSKFKVTSIGLGIPHMIARCTDCNWGDDMGAGGADARASVRENAQKHVAQTGHTVNVEQMISSQYLPEEPEEELPPDDFDAHIAAILDEFSE